MFFFSVFIFSTKSGIKLRLIKRLWKEGRNNQVLQKKWIIQWYSIVLKFHLLINVSHRIEVTSWQTQPFQWIYGKILFDRLDERRDPFLLLYCRLLEVGLSFYIFPGREGSVVPRFSSSVSLYIVVKGRAFKAPSPLHGQSSVFGVVSKVIPFKLFS